MYSISEEKMWEKPSRPKGEKLSVASINEKYERGEHRIVTENNREKLPNFIDALKKSEYMNIRPFYQRRPRWDTNRRSKLIESFIINIPVPPVFLYEKSFNSFEVMDGQQRITAIKDYYHNKYKLSGLELWPELNGMYYSDLPNKIRSGLDRRSIESIVLLKESAADEEEAIFLRQVVFERLNTGGIKLERQEIRNSLGTGAFNDILISLTRNEMFRDIWDMPRFSEEETTNHKLPIFENKYFKKMEDLEIVLRFFALRHMNNFRFGIQGFLDLYMIRSKNFTAEDTLFLRDLYLSTLRTAVAIYGIDNVFRFQENHEYVGTPMKGIYDAVMVPLSEFRNDFDRLVTCRDIIVAKTEELFSTHGKAAMTGRKSTKGDLENRINLFRQLYASVLNL